MRRGCRPPAEVRLWGWQGCPLCFRGTLGCGMPPCWHWSREAQGGRDVSLQPSPAQWHDCHPPPRCGSFCPSFGLGAPMGAPGTIRAPAPALGAPDTWVTGADGVCPQVAGEQKYHPECFSCLNCRTFIGDGDTYALVERSKLYWYVPAWACGWGGYVPWHPPTHQPPLGPTAGTAITRWW